MHNSFENKRDIPRQTSEGFLKSTNPRNRAWIEVHTKSIELNTFHIKQNLSRNCLLMAVVKADGYGHGAITVAKAALQGGANNLGVATLEEGIELRKAKLMCPILVLGNLINEAELEACLDWDLMPTISNFSEALICQNIALKRDTIFNIHIKVDTGMTRLGCNYSDAKELIQTTNSYNNINLQGIYSHLALADNLLSLKTTSVTITQQEKFNSIMNSIPNTNQICFHLANSAGAIRDQSLHYNMVRIGLGIYGYNPIRENESGIKKLKLNPALSVKARITLVRNVDKGIGVSYDHKYVTKRPSRLAVVSIGYADGISRSLSGKICVLCKGHHIPQVGAITMDQLVIDITDFLDVQVGNEVTLLGTDGKNLISPQQWGDINGSIPWEVLCGFKNRLPRVEV